MFNRFFEGHMSVDIPSEISPWQVFFVEEYLENQSAIMFKSHHSLSDGLGLVSLALSLADPRNFTNTFISFTRGNTLKQFLYYLKSIVMSPVIFYKVFAGVEPNTVIHGKELSGEKSFAVTDPISLVQIKKICENKKQSINTFLMTLVSIALQRYFEDNKERHDYVSVCVPYSMRTLPKDGSILPMKK